MRGLWPVLRPRKTWSLPNWMVYSIVGILFMFTTILVAYFMYLMGFVSHVIASRVVCLAAVLFLGSGMIGISHNFYWNAKSIETVALGGVLSTLQIVPLILLTVEAWRFRHMPQSTIARLRRKGKRGAIFGLPEAFLFLIGVNFWNFMGAGYLKGLGIPPGSFLPFSLSIRPGSLAAAPPASSFVKSTFGRTLGSAMVPRTAIGMTPPGRTLPSS